ncbi:hypothetical protein F5X98DRAFT_359723 [Xylaria grammica]|nr:hypothetical protein F5X98DRAFT_359723 [Xylaria grammica]
MQPYLPSWALDCVKLNMAPIDVPANNLDDHTPYIPTEPDGVGLGNETARLIKPPSSLGAKANTHGSTGTDSDILLELSETADDVQGLSMALNPVYSKAETDLMRWLMTLPCTEEVLLPWCRFWAEMHDQAQSYNEQIVTRSLFLQSLRRLESLRCSAFSDAAESYMLQDMEDVRATPSPLDHATLGELEQSEGYVAWGAVRAQLMQHVDAGYADDLAMLLDRQACFFREVQAHEIFSSYIEDVVTLDRLRARGFLCVEHPEGEEEKTYRRRLLDNRAALRLTNWQLRAIVMPGHNDVLTPEQASIYKDKFASSLEDSPPHNINVQHQPTIALDILVDRDQVDARLGYDLFRKLFGKIPPPSSMPASASISHATQKASLAKVGQSHAIQFVSPRIRPHDIVRESEKRTHLFATHANPGQLLHNPVDGAPGGTSGQGTDKSLFAMYERINQEKRTTSPSTRPPKRVKLVELTREDLAEDLETFNSCLKADLVGEIISSQTELASQVAEKAAHTEDLLSAKITKLVEESLDGLRSGFIKKLESQGEVQAKQTSDVMAASTRMENNLSEVKARLAKLEASLAKLPPKIGEDGFLTQNCPAPRGWNQKDYKALLTRAAINLIANQESPSGELLITIDKYTSVKDSFPDIAVQDFSIAFEHEYVRAFNRPLDRNKLLGLND